MKRNSSITRRQFTAGASAAAAVLGAPAIVRAQGAALKVGVLSALRRAGWHRPGLFPRRRTGEPDLQEHRPART